MEKQKIYNEPNVDGFTYCEFCNKMLEMRDAIKINDANLCKKCYEDNYQKCANCVDIVPKILGENGENGFMCKACSDANYITCESCGENIMKGNNVAGKYNIDGVICQDCVDDHYICCDSCGNYIDTNKEDMIEAENGKIICDICADDYYTCCKSCGVYIEDDNITFVANYGHYCDECLNEEFSTCESCGDYVENGCINTDPYSGATVYCDDCYNERFMSCESCGCITEYNTSGTCDECMRNNGGLCDYSVKLQPIKFIGDNLIEVDRNMILDKSRYIGMELEVEHTMDDTWDFTSEMDYKSKNVPDFIMKEDGSLDCYRGVEFNFQPMTLGALQHNNMRKFLKCIRENAVSYNSDGASCGIHLHIGKHGFSYEEMKAIQDIVHYNRRIIKKISQRGSTTYSNYEYVSKAVRCDYLCDQHYGAISFEHTDTIEFRMFRGTLYLPTMYSYFELIYAIVDYARGMNFIRQDIARKTINTAKGNDLKMGLVEFILLYRDDYPFLAKRLDNYGYIETNNGVIEKDEDTRPYCA